MEGNGHKKTLLEKAKEYRARKRPEVSFSGDEFERLEVYVAWLNGEINSGDVAAALSLKSTNAQTYASAALRKAIASGMAEISIKPRP